MPTWVIGDFTGGLNSASGPLEVSGRPSVDGDVNASRQQFPKMQGFLVSFEGALQSFGGTCSLTPSGLASPATGLTRYSNKANQFAVYQSGGVVYAFDEIARVLQPLTGGVNATARMDFDALYSALYMTNGVDRPLKWNGNVLGGVQVLGVIAPTTAPSAVAGGSGVLNSSGAGSSPYQWAFTYYDPLYGTESNLGPASASLSLTNQSATVSAIIDDPSSYYQKKLYRRGGTSTAWRYVATVNQGSSTYSDNTADVNLSQTQAPTTHDPPPAKATVIHADRNRLFLAGDPDNPWRVYISSLALPDYYPLVATNTAVDGGYVDVPDAEAQNAVVAISGTGSYVVIGCQKKVYAFEGDTADFFSIREISQTGVAARRSMVQCKNTCVYLGGDGVVYGIGGETEPVPISRDIEPTLKAVPTSDLVNACAAYHNENYVLSIPLAAGGCVTVCYDFRTGSWFDASDPQLSATALFGQRNATTTGELLAATPAGWVNFGGIAYNGINQWFMPYGSACSQTVTGGSSPNVRIDLSTGYYVGWGPQGQDGQAYQKRATRLVILGTYDSAAVGLSAKVTAIMPGRQTVTHTYPLAVNTVGPTILLNTELHTDLIGNFLSWEIVGVATNCVINSVELTWNLVRGRPN